MKKLKTFRLWCMDNYAILYIAMALYFIGIIMLGEGKEITNRTLVTIITFAVWIIIFVICIAYYNLRDEIRDSRHIIINLDKEDLNKAIMNLTNIKNDESSN